MVHSPAPESMSDALVPTSFARLLHSVPLPHASRGLLSHWKTIHRGSIPPLLEFFSLNANLAMALLSTHARGQGVDGDALVAYLVDELWYQASAATGLRGALPPSRGVLPRRSPQPNSEIATPVLPEAALTVWWSPLPVNTRRGLAPLLQQVMGEEAQQRWGPSLWVQLVWEASSRTAQLRPKDAIARPMMFAEPRERAAREALAMLARHDHEGLERAMEEDPLSMDDWVSLTALFGTMRGLERVANAVADTRVGALPDTGASDGGPPAGAVNEPPAPARRAG